MPRGAPEQKREAEQKREKANAQLLPKSHAKRVSRRLAQKVVEQGRGIFAKVFVQLYFWSVLSVFKNII